MMVKVKPTKKTRGFGWQSYFIFTIFLNSQWAANLFVPGSFVSNFYIVLRAFHKPFAIFYYLAVAALVVNILSLFPLYGYIFRVKILPAMVWKILFGLRVVLDSCGHYYEFVFLKTLFYDDLLLALEVLLAGLLVTVPSYLAMFYYAFHQEQTVGENQLKFN